MWSALLVLGCEPEGHELFVDLRTDFEPLQEFSQVEVFLERADGDRDFRMEGARPGADYEAGVRIAEFAGLPTGTYELRVRLLGDTGTRVERPILVTVGESLVVTALLTRSCEGVTCPTAGDPAATACLGGTCVDPTCTPETPERCGADECGAGAACESPAPCRKTICTLGACFYPPVEDACRDAEWCHPEDGCRPTTQPSEDAGVATDSGSIDSGVSDGGVDTGDAGSAGMDAGGGDAGAADAGGAAIPAPEAIAISVPRFSTTDSAFTVVPDSEVGLPGGADGTTWLVLWTAVLEATSSDYYGSAEARLVVDAEERALVGGYVAVDPVSDIPVGAFDVVTVPAGTSASLHVELRDDGGELVTLDPNHIVALALPSGVEHDCSTVDEVVLSSETSVPILTHTVEPGAGRFLVLATTQYREVADVETVFTRLRGPDGTWPEETQPPLMNHRAAPQTAFLARVVDVGAGAHDFSIEGWASNVRSPSAASLRHARLCSIRLDAWAGVVSDERPSDTTTPDAPRTVGTLSASVPAGRTHALVLSSMGISGESGDVSIARRARFVVDGETEEVAMRTDGNGPFGTVATARWFESPPSPLEVESAYWSDSTSRSVAALTPATYILWF